MGKRGPLPGALIQGGQVANPDRLRRHGQKPAAGAVVRRPEMEPLVELPQAPDYFSEEITDAFQRLLRPVLPARRPCRWPGRGQPGCASSTSCSDGSASPGSLTRRLSSVSPSEPTRRRGRVQDGRQPGGGDAEPADKTIDSLCAQMALSPQARARLGYVVSMAKLANAEASAAEDSILERLARRDTDAFPIIDADILPDD